MGSHKGTHPSPIRTVVASVVVGSSVAGVIFAVGLALPSQSAHATDSSSSAVTVTARSQDHDVANSPLPDLAVTVSQTKDLIAQGIQVSWTGGKKSGVQTSATGGSNFLQIMQCWGDDPNDPSQPDRTTCQYGGLNTPGDYRYSVNSDPSVIAPEDQQYTDPGDGKFNDPFTGIPFLSATGVLVESVHNKVRVPNVDPSANQFFTRLTTNEVSWAGSSSDGTGSAKFEIQTAAQSPGLGCGAAKTSATGAVTGSSCWLVIVPRGTSDPGQQYIVNSGLAWDAWKHKIAVRLNFQPVGARCAIGAAETQLAGSELIAEAVRSWQPQLCSGTSGSSYTLINEAESDALAAANGTTTAPLALTSRALTGDTTDSMVYAPVALTGVAISFAIDRVPSTATTTPQSETDQAQMPLTSLKLTPRLVAKLLTNSYIDSLPSGADLSYLGYKGPLSPGKNARNLTADPDFLAINDASWKYQAITSASIGDLLTPLGRSDTAWALWSYVLADADARAFLSGQADPWGMVVNPWSSIDASVNKSGTAFAVPREDFPRADPVELAGAGGAGPVNLVTWRPYVTDLDTAANLTLRGDGQILGAWDFSSSPGKYTKQARSLPGFQSVLGLTDTASAAKYQVYTAELRNPAGVFVAPTTDTLLSAASAMTTSATQPQVASFDFSSSVASSATNAYPLAMPVYAAVNPSMTDATVRSSYATFVTYAATQGQQSGTAIGQLPAGYAPIPAAWRTQALDAASTMVTGFPTGAVSSVAPPSSTSTDAVNTADSTSEAGATPASIPTASSASATVPAAQGTAAGSLIGDATPADPNSGVIAATVPVSIAGGLGAAFTVPLLSRFRRRL